VLAWASSGLTKGLLVLAAVLFAVFGLLAWKVIIEDYVHGAARKAVELANAVFFTALGVAAVIFILQIASGSAPTGA
jgi:succinate dehydrogenase hydrophobic anchor subunit